MRNWDIVPFEGIGTFKLYSSIEDIKKILDDEKISYYEEIRDHKDFTPPVPWTIIHIDNMFIYFPRAIVLYLILTFIARPIACALVCIPFKCSLQQIIFISFAGLRGASSICFAMLALVSLDNAIIQLFFIVVFMIVLISI